MINNKLQKALLTGENVATEFKLCDGEIGAETYKTVSSFLNRFGGDIFLGIDDNKKVKGIPKNSIPDLIKNFIKVISNPELVSPTVYLVPEVINYNDKQLIHIHIPPSSEVHSFKKVIYDRVDDSDVKVTSTSQIASLYIRKQNIFTEKKVYPYVKDGDLRLDLLPRIRQLAVNRNPEHPWKDLSDKELLVSAGLYSEDKETGKKGYNLAAVMLLGNDDVIKSVVPVYRTDALVRKINLDRYDDRLIVETNLIESYNLLFNFACKHLWDKFYLEGTSNMSLRDTIIREMLVNTLMHREFTSSYISKFVIENDRMYTENANRAAKDGFITPDNLEPNPKNPIIASFFRNIGMADELGSGVRKLFYYGYRYSGKEPELVEGDIFRIFVPLNDGFSYDVETEKTAVISEKTVEKTVEKILENISKNPQITQKELSKITGLTIRGIEWNLSKLKEEGILERIGPDKGGYWRVIN